MMLALRLARRELRGGVRGLWIVLLCLALGVAVIAAVGTLRAATDRGLAAEGRRILGGDLEVESGSQPLPDALPAWLRARGARLSEVVQMRSMLVAASGQRQLVELKAVDAAWPLVGEVQAKPAQPLAAALSERDGRYGLLAERVVLDRLGLRPGDVVRLGSASFVLRGELVSEPDRVAAPLMLGPRVLIPVGALADTGLIVRGSMVQYAVRASLADPAATPGVIAALRAAFPDTGWRIREPRDAAPGVTRFIDRTSLFLTLVGLTSLLVGGIGVANGTRAWLEARAQTIATLRCLGASSRLVFAVCLIQVLSLSLCGIVLGLVVGTLLPIGLVAWLKDVLPVPPVLGVYPGPVLLAGGYGLLTALAFSIVAAGPGGAHSRRGAVPRRADPAAGARRALARRGQRRRRRRARGPRDRNRGGPGFRGCGSVPRRWRRWGCSTWVAPWSCWRRGRDTGCGRRPGGWAWPICIGRARRHS